MNKFTVMWRNPIIKKMISESTKVNVIDNSGVLEGKCIKVILPKSYYGRRVGKIGDVIVLTVTKTLSGSKIKKGDVMKGLIVRTKRIQDGNRANICGSTVSRQILTNELEKDRNLIVNGKRSNIAGYRKSFNDNSVVLIKMGGRDTNTNKRTEIIPIGSRIKGPISESLRLDKYCGKLISICI